MTVKLLTFLLKYELFVLANPNIVDYQSIPLVYTRSYFAGAHI